MMLCDSIRKRLFLLAATVSLFFAVGCREKELEPTPPEPSRPTAVARAALQFQPLPGLGEDVREARLTTQPLPQLHSRLEIVTIVVKAGKPVTLPIQNEALLELRAGSLATITENNREQRHRGDMWQVGKGERITLQAFGELAVVRAIYLIPGEK